MKKEVLRKTVAKTAGLLSIVFALGLLFTGCTTNKGMYDKTVPEEQQATLEFSSALTVKSFDGAKVSWKAGLLIRWWAQGLGKVVVKIPSGNHELVADYWVYKETNAGYYTRQESRSADNLAITFDFQPGRVYIMTPSTTGGYVSLDIREKTVK
ncbi:hypothetical protein AGMMS50268_21340 [Spirochaetia bacterium]|nr:hypothetical protein AGMMS50268_21340 [Spirochaetia bacterium]